tara:strand:+ start:1151 stop:2104 length:954 start_codon:yes stop_codon:yes gene_type:complete
MRKVLAYKVASKLVVLPRSTGRMTLGSILSLIITKIISSRDVVVVLVACASDIFQRNFSFTTLGNQLTNSEEIGGRDIESRPITMQESKEAVVSGEKVGPGDIESRSITTQESKEAVVSSEKIAPINSEDRTNTMQESKARSVPKGKHIRFKTSTDADQSEVAKLNILQEADPWLKNIMGLILNDKKDKVVFEKAGVSWKDDFEIIYQYLENKKLGVFLMTVIKHGLTGIVIPDKERKELEVKLSFYSTPDYNKDLVKINFRKLLQEKKYDTLMRSLPEIKSSSQCSYSFRDTKSENYLQEKAGGPLRKRESMSKLI